MTIEFSLPINSRQPRDRFTVIIERDGTMTFPGFDFEQDDMMAFMTGQESNPRKLLQAWGGTPSQCIKAIGNMLGLKPKVIRSLATDWVEHTFDTIGVTEQADRAEKEVIEYIRKNLVKAIGLVRRSIQHNSPVMGTDKYLIEAHDIAEELFSLTRYSQNQPKGQFDIVWNVTDSLRWLSYNYGGHWRAKAELHDEWDAWLLRIAADTWKARAYSYSDGTSTAEWAQGHIDESEWQIRRFHDVVWAIQNKRPRPSIKETP